jgi:glutamate-1-semialdehyde aminotransferase
MLFTEEEPQNWRDVISAASPKMALLEAEFLKQGLFVLPGNRRFISIRHTEDDLESTFEIADRVCRKLRG